MLGSMLDNIIDDVLEQHRKDAEGDPHNARFSTSQWLALLKIRLAPLERWTARDAWRASLVKLAAAVIAAIEDHDIHDRRMAEIAAGKDVVDLRQRCA